MGKLTNKIYTFTMKFILYDTNVRIKVIFKWESFPSSHSLSFSFLFYICRILTCFPKSKLFKANNSSCVLFLLSPNQGLSVLLIPLVLGFFLFVCFFLHHCHQHTSLTLKQNNPTLVWLTRLSASLWIRAWLITYGSIQMDDRNTVTFYKRTADEREKQKK